MATLSSDRGHVPEVSSSGASLRVMENDADRTTMSRPDAAYTVPEIHAIDTASPLHRAMVNREYNAVTLSKRHNDRS